MKRIILKGLTVTVIMLLSSCALGPDYVRPSAKVPAKFKETGKNFKETGKNFKLAKPYDDFDRGKWWKIFKDPELNALETRVNISNQNIATALAQYQQAYALVEEAEAAFYPTVTAAASINRSRQATPGVSAATTATSTSASGTTTALGSSQGGAHYFHSLLMSASWVPDIWGLVRRQVEADKANAQATYAQLSLVRLTSQASLAQYYFELRGLDRDQQLLDATVKNYQQLLKIVLNQYASGTAGQADIVQARTQLETAQAAAINNHVNRAIYEHAIAVLIGEPASTFSIKYKPHSISPPPMPVIIPSELLQRRPDIANAERLVAQANAQVGIAEIAFFPTLTLSASGSVQHQGFNTWFSYPLLNWAIGAQLAETMFDGGSRWYAVCAACASYKAAVATYRETVLAAFQNVEDNLATLRILQQQQVVDDKAASDARLALKLVINQYKAGTVPFSSVITAETTAFTAEKNAADIRYQRMVSAVNLMLAIGGGWNAFGIQKTCQLG